METRHGAGSVKRSDQPCFTPSWPLVYPFLAIPPFLLPAPLPPCAPSPVCSFTNPPNIQDLRVHIRISHNVPDHLQYLDSPSASMIDEVCFPSLAPLCLPAGFLSLYILFTASPFSYENLQYCQDTKKTHFVCIKHRKRCN